MFCAKIFAQDPIRYSTKQGLPTNHIYDIQEDADGFMWFATNRGLIKFDGETFKTFTIQRGLPNNDTWLLELDYQGKLWYFSKSSYQGYIVNDSIYKFQTVDKIVISPRFTYKNKDSLWFFSNDGIQTIKNNKIKEVGLYSKYNNKEFNEWLLTEFKKKGLENYYPLPNPDTRELALFSEKEILFYDWDFNFITKIKQSLPSTLNNSKIQNSGLLYNNIYFNAFDKGVLFINFKTKTSKYIPFSSYANINSVNYFKCKGLKNEIQISIPGHLLIFNYNLELINSYSFPDISNNRISYKDSNGNIWLADFTQGVTFIPNTQLQSIYFLKGKKTKKLGVIDNQLIAGVNDVGFFKYSNNSKKFKFLIGDIGESNAEIYQIKENPNYLVSARKSFSYINNELSTIQLNLVEGLNNTIQTSFKDIINLKNNTYYVGSANIIKKTQEETVTLLNKSGLLLGSVFNDKLFVASSDGLFQLKNDSLIKPFQNNVFLNISIISLTTTPNNLWVGTDGRGVYSYNEEKVRHIKNTDGLSVQRIIKKDTVLWLATQNGVKKVALNKNSIENSLIIDAFYETDGLLQNNINDIFLEDSLLYAASDIGIAKLDLTSPIYKKSPKLYFKKQQDTLRFIDNERDNISVSFSVLDFVNQNYINYQYRLFPKQKEWVNTETETIFFSNLSPDVYILEIKATDQHNNSTVIKKYLNVVPKWWQTIAAKICFGLIIIGFLLLINKYLTNRIRKKEHEKARQDKRVAGLELQALRSQMNPHFVHNSLNAIQYYIQRNEVELSENYLVKFSKLIRLFFEYSRRQSITISEELELLTNYLEIEKLRFEEKLNFDITVCENIDVEEQLIPSMLLQPIVENAVNHGLFHKQENGLVSIDFTQLDEDTFQVIVKDDGIGIKKAKDIYKRSSKNYQSNSSAVLHERLDLLNQSKDWNINYNIQDRSDINKGEGTIVTLTFNQIEA
ncbi:histidine kinase [Lutibacter sp.]|uniref:sensor histidine kinase n=1 Tax=Lutibacter sp. TaxID=1925666 RepID=UPI0035691555